MTQYSKNLLWICNKWNKANERNAFFTNIKLWINGYPWMFNYSKYCFHGIVDRWMKTNEMNATLLSQNCG